MPQREPINSPAFSGAVFHCKKFISWNSRDEPGFEENKRVLQILITHKAIVPGSLGKKKKKLLFFEWEIQGLEKFIVRSLRAAANIEPKQSCNNLGCLSVFVCVCTESVGIKVIMLLINVALWLSSTAAL